MAALISAENVKKSIIKKKKKKTARVPGVRHLI